jgi:MtN3 and saliva related transmembrane protein
MLVKIFSIVVSIFGILMSIGYFPQAYKIWKKKSAENISLITYFIFFIGCFTWLVYGILLQDIPIIVSFIVGVIGSFLVLFMSLKYRN